MQHLINSTTSGNTSLSPVELENLENLVENHRYSVVRMGEWAMIGSIDRLLCRHCRHQIHNLAAKVLWEAIDFSYEEVIDNAAALDAMRLRISDAVMDAVERERQAIEVTWRAESVRNRYSPQPPLKSPSFYSQPSFTAGTDPNCEMAIPCYMRVEVTK